MAHKAVLISVSLALSLQMTWSHCKTTDMGLVHHCIMCYACLLPAFSGTH